MSGGVGVSGGVGWVIVSSSDEMLWISCGSGCHNSVKQHQSLRHARWVSFE